MKNIRFNGKHHSDETKKKIGLKLKEEKNHFWKGGISYHSKGYILLLRPNHPFASKENYVLEHRLVMEQHLGRVLLPTEVIHHINGIPNDNRIENLMLFKNNGVHRNFHKYYLKTNKTKQ